MIVIPNVFPEFQAMKILIRPLFKKRFFRKHFDSQHVKASQVLAKSPRERFYHVFFIIFRKVDLEYVSPSVR